MDAEPLALGVLQDIGDAIEMDGEGGGHAGAAGQISGGGRPERDRGEDGRGDIRPHREVCGLRLQQAGGIKREIKSQ